MSDTTSFYIVDVRGETTAPVVSKFLHSAKTVTAPVWTVLRIRDAVTRERMARAIRRAIEEHSRCVVMVGAEPDDRRMVTVRPAREPGQAVVSCASLGAGLAQLQPDAVIELFSVSPAEAEIALLLSRGSSLAEVAERRGVQQETVRGQVKVLLRKIGVANQKQLAATLAQVGAALLDLGPSAAEAAAGI